MLYTRNGDNGTTSLFNTKRRFRKDSLVYEALGTVDELNSLLGIIRASSVRMQTESMPWLAKEIKQIQEKLFIVQAELAGSDKRLSLCDTTHLEHVIQHCENVVGNPHSFVIPGGSMLSSLFDYARAVSRRTERVVLRAKSNTKTSPETMMYLNRLSSFLYALARLSASLDGVKETSPSY